MLENSKQRRMFLYNTNISGPGPLCAPSHGCYEILMARDLTANFLVICWKSIKNSEYLITNIGRFNYIVLYQNVLLQWRFFNTLAYLNHSEFSDISELISSVVFPSRSSTWVLKDQLYQVHLGTKASYVRTLTLTCHSKQIQTRAENV